MSFIIKHSIGTDEVPEGQNPCRQDLTTKVNPFRDEIIEDLYFVV